MNTYVIANMVFSDEKSVEFTAPDDQKAIAYFKQEYEMGTDDGGWSLSRKDAPEICLADTEGGPEKKKAIISYLDYE
jgi:hypothetical protein